MEQRYIERLVPEFEKLQGHQDWRKRGLAFLLSRALYFWHRHWGDLPPEGYNIHSPYSASLEEGRMGQYYDFIYKGFAKELGMSDEDYLASLPYFPAVDEKTRKQFPIPLLIETRIPLEKQLELVGISQYTEVSEFKDLVEVPDKPYATRVRYPNWYRGYNSIETVGMFRPDEVGCIALEVVSLYLHYPETFNGFILAPNTGLTSYKDEYGTPTPNGVRFIPAVGLDGKVPYMTRAYLDLASDAPKYSDMNFVGGGRNITFRIPDSYARDIVKISSVLSRSKEITFASN